MRYGPVASVLTVRPMRAEAKPTCEHAVVVLVAQATSKPHRPNFFGTTATVNAREFTRIVRAHREVPCGQQRMYPSWGSVGCQSLPQVDGLATIRVDSGTNSRGLGENHRSRGDVFGLLPTQSITKRPLDKFHAPTWTTKNISNKRGPVKRRKPWRPPKPAGTRTLMSLCISATLRVRSYSVQSAIG